MLLPLALVVLVGVQSVSEVPNPRPTGWVTDQAGVIDPADEATLTTTLAGLHRERGAEVVVVTVDDVSGSPKAFATALFKAWHLGSADRNDGVLMLLVVGQRRIEIETGTGLETALPAWWLTELQQQQMVPHFKRGALGSGLVAGAGGLRDRLVALPGETERATAPGEYRSDGTVVTPPAGGSTAIPATEAAPWPPAPTPPPPDRDRGTRAGVIGLVMLLVALAAVGGGAVWWVSGRRRRRRCQACAVQMLALDEIADDAHLSPGQRTEERIGSMNYEVLVCPGCQTARTLTHSRWFSSASRCPSCSFKTSKSSSRTLVQATYDHGGTVEVTEDCAHCGRHDARTRRTARRTRPSSSSSSSSSRSSSSSSRSSYSSSSSSSRSSSSSSRSSGGSSRGGGAGSSW